MYRLFKRIPAGLPPVADIFKKYVEREGVTLVKAAEEVRLLPIRPRSRGARRFLRTFPVVALHPRFPFNV